MTALRLSVSPRPTTSTPHRLIRRRRPVPVVASSSPGSGSKSIFEQLSAGIASKAAVPAKPARGADPVPSPTPSPPSPTNPSVNAGPSFSLSAAKADLLRSARLLQRGLIATPKDEEEVDALARALEARNPTPAPLASPLIRCFFFGRCCCSRQILCVRACVCPSEALRRCRNAPADLESPRTDARFPFRLARGGSPATRTNANALS